MVVWESSRWALVQERINPPLVLLAPSNTYLASWSKFGIETLDSQVSCSAIFQPRQLPPRVNFKQFTSYPPAPLEYMSYVTIELVKRLLRIVNVTEVADFNRQLFRRCVFLYLRRRQKWRVGRKLKDEDGDEAVEWYVLYLWAVYFVFVCCVFVCCVFFVFVCSVFLYLRKRQEWRVLKGKWAGEDGDGGCRVMEPPEIPLLYTSSESHYIGKIFYIYEKMRYFLPT